MVPCMTVYRVIILSDNYRLSLPAPYSQPVWAVERDVSRLHSAPSSSQGVTSAQATTFSSSSPFTHHLSIDAVEPKLLSMSLSKIQINMASKILLQYDAAPMGDLVPPHRFDSMQCSQLHGQTVPHINTFYASRFLL